MRLISAVDKSGKLLLEIGYLTAFSLLLIYQFLQTTMFQITWPPNYLFYVRIFLLSFTMIRLGYSEKYTFKEAVLSFCLLLISLVVFKLNGFEEVMNAALIIIGSKGIPFRRLVKIYVIITSVLLLVTMVSALTGVIENLVYTQEGRNTRIAFGCIYPTDFSAHVLYITLGFAYLRKECITYLELLGIGALSVFVYLFCQARLNCACLFLVMVAFGIYKFRSQYCKKKNKKILGNKLIVLLSVFPVLCAAVMILFSIFYSAENIVTYSLDMLLTHRLYLGKKGIEVYGFSLFGQWVPMQGNGGTVETQANYFFLDSSYLFILLQYGILIFALILIIILFINYRAQINRDYILIIAVGIMAVQCMVEHHLMDVAYNPFLWAAFAELGIEERQKKKSRWKRRER